MTINLKLTTDELNTILAALDGMYDVTEDKKYNNIAKALYKEGYKQVMYNTQETCDIPRKTQDIV